MKYNKTILWVGILLWVVGGISAAVLADTVYLKNGQTIEGTYLGGNQDTIRFQTERGVFIYKINQLHKLTFPSIPASLKQRTFLLPAETRMAVRIKDELDTLISKAGDRFQATLELDLVVDGVVVVPQATIVQGKVMKSIQGIHSSVLVITLQEILLADQVIPITTTNYSIWYRSRDTETSDTFKRSRILRIPSGASLEFKTMKPVEITLSL